MLLCLICWRGTIPILSLGCVSTIVALVALWNYRRRVKRVPLLIQAYSALVVGDIFMWANFLPRDIYNTAVGTLEDGIWCRISAFWTISCVVAINGLCMCVAYCTYLVCHKVFVSLKYPIVLYWSLASWGAGFGLASFYVVNDLLGPYKGLYCCVRQSAYTHYSVMPVFGSFAISICSMSYWYFKAFQYARALEDKNRQPRISKSIKLKAPEDVPRPVSSSSGVADAESQRVSVRVMKQGMWLVSSFYIGWFPISFIALLEYCKVNVPVEFDIFAGWVAKLSVIFNSAFIILSIAKVASKKVRSRQPKEDSSRSSGPSSRANVLSTLLRLLNFFHPHHHSSRSNRSIRAIQSTAPSSPRHTVGNPILVNYTEDQMLMFAIRNPTARKIFLSFCVKEFSAENLKFLVAYYNLLDYTKVSDLEDLKVAQTRVALIQDMYRMYLAKDAPREVNISAKVKKAIRATYQDYFKGGTTMSVIDSDNAIDLTVFDLAFQEVHTLVLNHSWPRFVKSEYYEDFLKQARKSERRRLREQDAKDRKHSEGYTEKEASVAVPDLKSTDTRTKMLNSLMMFLRRDIQNATEQDLRIDINPQRDDLNSVDPDEERSGQFGDSVAPHSPSSSHSELADVPTVHFEGFTPTDSDSVFSPSLC